MKNLFSAFAVLTLLTVGAVPASADKAAACCAKCDMKDGKCATHEAKKCAKDCAAACCKPAKKADHPKGEHPKGEHPKGDHPKGEHPKG